MKTKKKNKRKQRHGACGDSTSITLMSMECWTCRVGNYILRVSIPRTDALYERERKKLQENGVFVEALYERNMRDRCSKFSAINDHQAVLPDTELKEPDENEAISNKCCLMMFCGCNLIRFYTYNFVETLMIMDGVEKLRFFLSLSLSTL